MVADDRSSDPVTYVSEAQRALFDGRLTDGVIAQGAVSAGVLAMIGLALGTRAMRRANA